MYGLAIYGFTIFITVIRWIYWRSIWLFKCVLIFWEVVHDNLNSLMMLPLSLLFSFLLSVWFLLELCSFHGMSSMLLSLSNSLWMWSVDNISAMPLFFSIFLVYRHVDPAIFFQILVFKTMAHLYLWIVIWFPTNDCLLFRVWLWWFPGSGIFIFVSINAVMMVTLSWSFY